MCNATIPRTKASNEYCSRPPEVILQIPKFPNSQIPEFPFSLRTTHATWTPRSLIWRESGIVCLLPQYRILHPGNTSDRTPIKVIVLFDEWFTYLSLSHFLRLDFLRETPKLGAHRTQPAAKTSNQNITQYSETRSESP
jgi:hypothetical protein